MDSTQETLQTVHRVVGYVTVFIVAPAALFTFARAAPHRRWGTAYVLLMVFLYSTGLFMTLTRHE